MTGGPEEWEKFDLQTVMHSIQEAIDRDIERVSNKTTYEVPENWAKLAEDVRQLADKGNFPGCESRESFVEAIEFKKNGASEEKIRALDYILENI